MTASSLAQLTWRPAEVEDSALLSRPNKQLIEDQRHSNPATVPELEQRIRGWLAGGYRGALILLGSQVVGYALWRQEDGGVFLRQFFVCREWRRCGLGRRTFGLLAETVWSAAAIDLEVLVGNAPGVAFWRSLGFTDHSHHFRRQGP